MASSTRACLLSLPRRKVHFVPAQLSSRSFLTGPAPLLNPFPTRPAPRSTSFARPGPPHLPPAEQAEFDALIKAAESTSVPFETAEALLNSAAAEIEQAEQHHPDLRKGAGNEFEGEINPKTGEVGGPKRDPFMAGKNDWQYGGRVTDF